MAESMRGRGGGEDGGRIVPDIRLSWDDREDLLQQVAQVFPNEQAAEQVLRPLDYPRNQMPGWLGVGPEQWWAQVFVQFDNGIVAEPYRRLIASAVRRYRANPMFRQLADAYLNGSRASAAGGSPAATDVTPAVGSGTQAMCHVIVRASDEEERAAGMRVLRELGLDPVEVWATGHAVSYAVSSADPPTVRAALSRTNLGWTVVPPGQPDYLLATLFVQGPDGSRYRVIDAPAQQTFRNIASEVISEYDDGADISDASRPTVIDRVLADGTPERVNPDDTLHDAGIQDGDSLRVGFERRAGNVNPLDREDAMDRVRKQIDGYARSHPDVRVRANSATLPSEYEIDFTGETFLPGGDGRPPLRRVTQHTLLIQLGAEFPVTAPQVFWLTPIFHPNVFPNYDSEQARREPNLQGLVCLGVLAQSWHSSFHFGLLLQMLVDMGGYRNYDPTIQDSGDGHRHANYYDATAAEWARTHQAEIEAIGGTLIDPQVRTDHGYPNVIQRIG